MDIKWLYGGKEKVNYQMNEAARNSFCHESKYHKTLSFHPLSDVSAVAVAASRDDIVGNVSSFINSTKSN